MDVETSVPTENPGPPRFLRWATPFVVTASLLLALYFAPQLPAVRAWLLTRVESATQAAGYSLSYSASSGNLWGGLRLGGAKVSGSGLDVRADKLTVDYFLPALLTGKLPLAVTAEGVRGTVALKGLTSPGGSDKAVSVRPVLRNLDLKDVSVKLTDVPYTLPDLTVTNLQARPVGDAFRAEAELATSEGTALVNGTLSWTPLRFTADVPRMDARLARQWWQGVTGGTLAGTVTYQNGRLRADAELANGSVTFLGETVTGLSGKVAYQDAAVTADLSGSTLGGNFSATGTVDLTAQRWSAEADGAVNLRDAALWLAAGRSPADLSSLPLSGSAQTHLSASGWQTLSLSGAATGAGSVAGYALDNLNVDYGFDSAAGARVSATGNLAGGALQATLTPQENGFSFDLSSAGLELSPTVTTDVKVALEQTAGTLSGKADAALTGALLGKDLQVNLGGTLDAGAVQAKVGGTVLGSPLTGTVSFQDGAVNGRLTLPSASLPALKRPVGLVLAADGPASALPLSATLTTPEPTGIVLGPLVIPKDIGGQVSATLRGAGLEDITGGFGTLSVAGKLALNARNGALAYSLKNTPLSGVVNGEASIQNGTLTLADGVLDGKATLTSSRLSLPGVTVPPLDGAALTFRHEATWTAALTTLDDALALAYNGSKLQATTANYPVTVAGQSLELSGTSNLSAQKPLDSLEVDVTSKTPFGDVAFSGGAAALRFDLETPRFGPTSRLAGTLNLLERRATLNGQLGALDVSGSGGLDGENVRGALNVQGGGELLELSLGGKLTRPDLALNGRLPLNLIGDLFNRDASGTLNADLRRSGDRYQGSAELAGTLASVPVQIRLTGDGDSLGVTGNATPFAVPIELAGRLQPTLELNATSDIGSVALDGRRVTGEGTVPSVSVAGFTLSPQPWTLSGDLASGTATFLLPETASHMSVERGATGWRVAADLERVLTRGDSTFSLVAKGDGSSLSGEVKVQTPAGDAALPFTGSLPALELSGNLPAPVAASLFSLPIGLNGDFAVTAKTQLSGTPTYTATAAWQTPDNTLTAQLEGRGTSFAVTAAGDNLEIRYSPEALTVAADGFQLEPFLSSVQGSLSGTLNRTPATGWDGALSLEARAPVALQATLSGAGAGLGLSADYATGSLSARTDGTLLPTLDLTLSGAFRDLATLQGRVSGPLSQPEAAATLTTQPVNFRDGLVNIPAQTVSLTAGFADGLRAQLQGDALALELSQGTLQGRLRLPFTMQGEAQVVSADLGGTLTRPTLRGAVAGNIVSGPVAFDKGNLTTTLQLDPSPLLNDLPLAAPTLTLTLTGARDLSWQAQLKGTAKLRNLPLEVGGALSGEGTNFAGNTTVSVAGESVPVTVSGRGGGVRVDANVEAFDLSSLAPALPVTLSGMLGGAVNLDTSAPQPLSFDLATTGAVQGRAFDLTAKRGDGQLLSVAGEVAGTPVSLSHETDAYLLNLGSSENPLSLAGRLELAPFGFHATGHYLSQPVTVTADYTSATATWSAAVGGATFLGSARRTDGAWTLHSTLNSPADGVLPFSGQAEVAARVENGDVTLETFTVNTAFSGRAVGLELSGPAWPAPALTGSLALAGFGRSDIAIASSGGKNSETSGYSATLTYDRLNLSTTFSAGLALETVALTGDGELPVGSGVTLTSDLKWTADGGFRGKTVADAAFGDALTVALTAVGSGPLGVAGQAVFRAQEVARLELALTDNPLVRPDLTGRLELNGDLGRFIPAYRTLTPTATILTANLDMTGKLTSPRLAGPVTLQGALATAGTFSWNGTAGRLELLGTGLNATGEVDAAGWTLAAQTDALDLTSLLPQLAAPHLDATVIGNGTWGEPPALQAETFSLQTPNGSLTGNVRYDGTLSGRLEADLALADLMLGPTFQGRVTGELSLGAATGATSGPDLTGTLQGRSLGLAGQAALLDGDLNVSGPLAAPDLSVSLRGAATSSAAASGTLFANLTPSAGRYAVSSTLNIGDVASDFAVSLDAADLSASGHIAYRDYALSVGIGADSLTLTGSERLEGWQVELAPAASRLDLRGPLAALNDALTGTVSLSVNLGATRPSADGPWLGGALQSLKVGPLEVGDVNVTSSGTRGLSLTGDNLAATLSLQNGVTWNLERFTTELPGAVTLTATGQGSVTSADLNASVSGVFQGETFDLPATLAYKQKTVTVTSDAELFGGRFAVNARGSAADGWQGAVEAESLSLSGVTATLTGSLSGPLQAPELSAALNLRYSASPATVFSGRATAALDALSLTGNLVSPLLESSLNVTGTFSATPELILQTANDTLTLATQDGLLTAAGKLELKLGPVRAALNAPLEANSHALDLSLNIPSLPGFALTSALLKVAPTALPAVLAEGLVFQGSQNTGGSVLVTFADGPSAELRALSLQTLEGNVSLSGTVTPGASRLAGRWQGNADDAATLPWLATLTQVGFEADLSGNALSVQAAGNGSHLDARYDLGTRNGTLDAALDLPTGGTQVQVTYDAMRGPDGSVTFTDFPVFSGSATGDAHLSATLTFTPAALAGTADLELGEGKLALSGSLGLARVLPNRFVPQGTTQQNVTARLDTFDVENLPWLARVLPFVRAPLSGDAALQGGALSGQLTAPVTVAGDGVMNDGVVNNGVVNGRGTAEQGADSVLPLSLTLGGKLGQVEAQGALGRSTFTLSRSGGTLVGLVRFDDFPLEKAVAAVAGPSEVSASLTGALRFEIPGGVLEKSYIRFSSERFVLEENGVVTQGSLSFELVNGALTIQKAAFEGVGRWEASGVASRERLDLRFDAADADFGPLLRLVPQLAGLNVGAFGSVQLLTSGSLVNPVVKATLPALELSLGGSAYRVSDTSLTVQDSDFVTSGRVDGVAPLTGNLAFSGGGQVKLAAPRRFDLTLRFQGDPQVPALGTLKNVQGTVSVQPGEPWRIATTGVLGNPFKLSGSLSPLDLHLTGEGLNLRAPHFFLSSSVTDADLRFFRDDRFHLAGSLFTRQAVLDLESRKEAAAANLVDSGDAPATAAPESAPDAVTDTAPQAVQPEPQAEPQTAARGRSPFLERLLFDNLSFTAPQQIDFSENFGSGELGNISLVLSGTAAQPSLNGSASALRGTVRFAGRDFTLQQALATFEPAQGLYPTLDIVATTTFDKLQVLNGLADQVGFVEPKDGADFDVTLNLTGAIEPNPEGPKPYKVDISPSLSSNATIELRGAPGTRPLSEPELFSLLTLGKLELSPEFAQGNVVGSLAQGAIDTAVDFLILSELQRGLGDALGLDLLEIRTTPLGSLLTGDSQAFGVSLRLGGYLSDEVFASYEIGSLGLGADVSLRNAFNVRYSLGALEFSLAGKLDLYRNAGLEPLPEIDLNLAYAFSPLVRLETGLNLSTAKQGVRFGVSLRW